MFPGLKILVKPKVSLNFEWNAKAVLALNRSTIYILSGLMHADSNLTSVGNDDSLSKDNEVKNVSTLKVEPNQSNEKVRLYICHLTKLMHIFNCFFFFSKKNMKK